MKGVCLSALLWTAFVPFLVASTSSPNDILSKGPDESSSELRSIDEVAPQSQRELQTPSLTDAGNDNDPVSAFPLGNCEGDCDTDADCEEGLICFQRNRYTPVPGCSGQGIYNRDYCIVPQPGVLTKRGDETKPMGLCEGDCDRDSDCEGDLICFFSSIVETVPGCVGLTEKGVDYCYTPLPTNEPTTQPTQIPTQSPTAIPTTIPTQSPTGSPVITAYPTSSTQNPTDSPTIHPTSVPTVSPTYVPTIAPTFPALTEAGNNNSPASAYPLGICEGDCDSDADCQEGLICYQRKGFYPIPGCTGDGIDGRDYCVIPQPGVLTKRGDETKPMGLCEGDCDSDSDCEGDLICFFTGTVEPVPGCIGLTEDGVDYCYNPNPQLTPGPTPSLTSSPSDSTYTEAPSFLNTPVPSPYSAAPTLGPQTLQPSRFVMALPPLTDLGDDANPESAFPLGPCEGDCDTDADCDEDLICFQRKGFTPVPGCSGYGTNGRDYCIEAQPGVLTKRGDETKPMGLCEGDCDSDSDCIGDLVCFFSDIVEPVPGCVGLTEEGVDYCYMPPTQAPTPYSNNTVPPPYYRYTGNNPIGDEDFDCGNIRGPAPFQNGSNIVIQFLAFGDTPYDGQDETCIDNTGSKINPCLDYSCRNPPYPNNCTYEGLEYQCVKDAIIPYMKTRNDTAAFAVHIGDILDGAYNTPNNKCSASAYESRRDLFSGLQPDLDFLIVPGDNEWNECVNFDRNSATDEHREVWRNSFANSFSPFYEFQRDFPLVLNGSSARPSLMRQTSDGTPENFFFLHNDVAFFGISQPNDRTPTWTGMDDLNAAWVSTHLGPDMATCAIRSIVIISQVSYSNKVATALNSYFAACGDIPVLNVKGDTHPATFCMEKLNNVLRLTVEARKSAPLMVSIVEDNSGTHWFHVESTSNSTMGCPVFA